MIGPSKTRSNLGERKVEMALRGGMNADKTDSGLVDHQVLRTVVKEKSQLVLSSESARMHCRESVLRLFLILQISGLKN